HGRVGPLAEPARKDRRRERLVARDGGRRRGRGAEARPPPRRALARGPRATRLSSVPPAMAGVAIEVEDLRKSYGSNEAVRGISFEVAAGEVFGFLGPNGAGKSTTINMLCTLAKPTAGSAAVAGFNVATQRDDVRRHIGLVFQDPTLDGYLSAYENLRLHA